MADKNTDALEAVEEESGKETPKKSPMGKMIPLIIVIILILGGGFLAVKGGLLKKIFGAEGEAAVAGKKSAKQVTVGPILGLETFIVNLADPSGKRYLKIKVELELENAVVMDEINKRLPQLRDIVITLLSSKSFADINSMEGKFALRAEMASLINRSLNTGKVQKVFFTDFIIQ